MPLEPVLDLLWCPRCHCSLALVAGAVRCPQGHAYDVARQGYLNLLGGPPPRHADTASMVSARDRFLGQGWYGPIGDALARIVDRLAPDDPAAVAEVGAGTAYYLTRLMGPPAHRGLAIDISVPAARRAARAHKRIGAVVADVWQHLPVPDGSLDLLLDVFAPRNAGEFARVLRRGGLLVVGRPQPDHLAELRTALGLLDVGSDKQAALASLLGDRFTAVEDVECRFGLALPAEAVTDLVIMGPNGFHLDRAEVERRVVDLETPVPVTAAVSLSAWRRR
jgi:SAM-dependent methyltransferase